MSIMPGVVTTTLDREQQLSRGLLTRLELSMEPRNVYNARAFSLLVTIKNLLNHDTLLDRHLNIVRRPESGMLVRKDQ